MKKLIKLQREIKKEKIKEYKQQQFEKDIGKQRENKKQEMLDALGIDGSGLDKLITATYDILGLATYFTVGRDVIIGTGSFDKKEEFYI